MNYPRCIRGQKVAFLFAFCHNLQPWWDSVRVSRKKFAKSLGKKLLDSIVFS
jgi:hypothetical protein